MLWLFQVNSKGPQPYLYRYPLSPRLPSHPGCHITAELPVLYSRSLLVFCFKYSSMYMSIPNSLTIPSPHPSPLAKSLLWTTRPSTSCPVLKLCLIVSYSMSLFLCCLERMSVLHFRPQRQEWKHGEVWHALGHHSFPPHVSWALCWAPDTVRPGEHKAPALQRLRLVSGFLSDPGSYKALPTVLGWEMATLLGTGSPDPMTPRPSEVRRDIELQLYSV